MVGLKERPWYDVIRHLDSGRASTRKLKRVTVSWRRCPSGIYNSKTTKCVMVEWQAHRVRWMSWSKLLGLGSTDDVDILKSRRKSRRTILLQDSLELSSTRQRLGCLASVNTENGFGARLDESLEKRRIHSLIVSICSTPHLEEFKIKTLDVESNYGDLYRSAQSAEAHNQVRFTTSGVFGDCQTQSRIRRTRTKIIIRLLDEFETLSTWR